MDVAGIVVAADSLAQGSVVAAEAGVLRRYPGSLPMLVFLGVLDRVTFDRREVWVPRIGAWTGQGAAAKGRSAPLSRGVTEFGSVVRNCRDRKRGEDSEEDSEVASEEHVSSGSERYKVVFRLTDNKVCKGLSSPQAEGSQSPGEGSTKRRSGRLVR